GGRRSGGSVKMRPSNAGVLLSFHSSVPVSLIATIVNWSPARCLRAARPVWLGSLLCIRDKSLPAHRSHFPCFGAEVDRHGSVVAGVEDRNPAPLQPGAEVLRRAFLRRHFAGADNNDSRLNGV